MIFQPLRMELPPPQKAYANKHKSVNTEITVRFYQSIYRVMCDLHICTQTNGQMSICLCDDGLRVCVSAGMERWIEI